MWLLVGHQLLFREKEPSNRIGIRIVKYWELSMRKPSGYELMLCTILKTRKVLGPRYSANSRVVLIWLSLGRLESLLL
jgi:hypothetical protein